MFLGYPFEFVEVLLELDMYGYYHLNTMVMV